MKKTLLLLASMLMTLATFAQWTMPTPAHVDQIQYSNFVAEGGDTIVYYLYNKDAKAFFTEGNSWGTQASLGDEGLKTAISKYIATDAEGNPTEWDGKTVLIYDYSLVKNSWKELFLANANECYVDRNGQVNYFWELTPAADGIYHIGVAEINPDHNQTTLGGGENYIYFGLDGNSKIDGSSNVLSFKIDITDDAEAAVDWYFVSAADYATYQNQLACYKAAAQLKEAIDKAVGYDIDTTEALNIYNNSSSTLEQLTSAASTLNGAIAEKAFMDATEDNPFDATGWIVNPNFDQGNIKGWDSTFAVGTNAAEVGFQNNSSFTNGEATLNGFMQAWDGGSSWNSNVNHRALGVGQLSQTIKNMPQGKYKFTVDAIACYEPTQKLEDALGVELFAQGGSVNIKENIATARAPEHYEITFINSGGDITMGVRTTEECSVTWIALDNFTLTYYGKTEDDPYKVMLDGVIKNALAQYPIEGLDEMVAYTGDKENYRTTIETAQKATSDYEAQAEAVKQALDALKASKDAYAAYTSLVGTINNYYLEHDPNEAEEAVIDYVMEGNEVEPCEAFPNGSAAYILSNLYLTTEQIIAETEFIDEMYNSAKNSGIQEGDDITGRLANPSFDDGMNGWSYDTTYTNADPKSPQNIADGWNYHFNVYQTLKGVPNGIYKLQAQAFYREEQNSTSSYEHYIANPEAYVSPAYIYLNSAEKSVNSIASKTFTEGEFEGGFESVADGIYLPNNNAGVYSVFNAGYYENEVIGIVSDNTLTFGIKSLTATGSGRWTAFDNFRLTYIGNDPALYAQLTSEQVEALKKLIEANKDGMSTPVLNAANQLVESATSITSAEAANALLQSINETTTAISANVASVASYPAAYNKLVEVLTKIGVANVETAAAPYLADVKSLETAEIDTLISHIGAAISNAPAQAGYVLTEGTIVNPTFDTTIEGWTNEYVSGENATDVGWQNSYAENSADKYEEAIIDQCVQAWADTEDFGPLGDGKVYQTIASLPAGEYLLVVDIIASDQSAEPIPVTGAYLFAQEGTAEAISSAIATEDYQPETFYLKFTKQSADTDVTIGFYTQDTNANWIAADNFRLYTLGDATSIHTAQSSSASASAIYTLAGNRVKTLQKGINILRTNDGTIRKVLVK